MGGAPEGHPSIVSRLIDTDYTAQVCEKAFPAGKLNSECSCFTSLCLSKLTSIAPRLSQAFLPPPTRPRSTNGVHSSSSTRVSPSSTAPTTVRHFSLESLFPDRRASSLIFPSFAAWLYATPHSPYAPKRADTIKRPFKVIPGGVHHWDENGRLDGKVPKAIRKVHEEEVEFVKAWLKEWEERGRWKTGAWRD